MAALTKARMTRVKKAGGMDFPVAAGVKIYQHAYVVLDGGYLKPATAKAGLTRVGRASDTVDNTGGAAGAKSCHVDFMKERVFFPFMVDQTKLFVATDLGKEAYFLDDQTVSPDADLDDDDAPQRSPAGSVFRIEGTGATQVAWVEV